MLGIQELRSQTRQSELFYRRNYPNDIEKRFDCLSIKIIDIISLYN